MRTTCANRHLADTTPYARQGQGVLGPSSRQRVCGWALGRRQNRNRSLPIDLERPRAHAAPRRSRAGEVRAGGGSLARPLRAGGHARRPPREPGGARPPRRDPGEPPRRCRPRRAPQPATILRAHRGGSCPLVAGGVELAHRDDGRKLGPQRNDSSLRGSPRGRGG